MKIGQKIVRRAAVPRNWFLFFAFFATGISVQSLLLGLKEIDGVILTHYNNYVIFKYSFWHLLNGIDLYIPSPSEHYDLFKYSPTFALFFSFLAYLPDWLGLVLWNLLNAFSLVFGLYMLKGISNEKKAVVLSICAIELFTSLHNAQANGLMAGLMILSFAFLQRDQIALATLAVALTFFIKIFGVVAFSLFLFFPGKARMLVWTVVWFLLLFLAPLLVVDWTHYAMLLKSWFVLLTADHDRSFGFSLLGWLYYWFGLNPGKNFILIFGVLSFVALLFRVKCYTESLFRFHMLSLVLLWVILFNHMTESPTLIIGMAGAAIWFVVGEKNRFNLALMAIAIVFTSLSSTDLFPYSVRKTLIYPYVVKVFPLILIWLKLQYDLWVLRCPCQLDAPSRGSV